jgi:hypothetical protein
MPTALTLAFTCIVLSCSSLRIRVTSLWFFSLCVVQANVYILPARGLAPELSSDPSLYTEGIQHCCVNCFRKLHG